MAVGVCPPGRGRTNSFSDAITQAKGPPCHRVPTQSVSQGCGRAAPRTFLHCPRALSPLPIPIPPPHTRSQRAKKVRTPGNLTPWPTSHPAEERDRRKKAPAPPSQVSSSPGPPAIPVNTWYQRMNKTANRRGCHSSTNLVKSRGSHHSGLLSVTHPPTGWHLLKALFSLNLFLLQSKASQLLSPSCTTMHT